MPVRTGSTHQQSPQSLHLRLTLKRHRCQLSITGLQDSRPFTIPHRAMSRLLPRCQSLYLAKKSSSSSATGSVRKKVSVLSLHLLQMASAHPRHEICGHERRHDDVFLA